MSVCGVPLCPNLSVGGTQPLTGALKGVPRVNRAGSETRDRLRIRLHQRKESLKSKISNVPQSHSNPSLANCISRLKQESKPEAPTTNRNGLAYEDKPITNMIKKAGIDTFTKHCVHLSTRRGSGKKCDSKSLLELKNKTIAMAKDKENKPLEENDLVGPTSIRRGINYEDIDKIMKYIEGKNLDVLAQKKAAKKARQKQKKEEEKRKKEEEEEARRKAEEERIKQELRLQEEKLKAEMLAKNAALKKNKKNKNQQQTQQQNETSKTKKKNKKVDSEPELYEETIPAMVTIKRIVENNNSPPTVTITLKGSTPDQDKLLYTLVNGHSKRNSVTTESKKNEMTNKNEEKNNKKKKKGSEKADNTPTVQTTTKEMKVTLAVDKSFRKELENKAAKFEAATQQKNNKKASNQNQQQAQQVQQQQQQQQPPKESKKQASEKSRSKENIIDIPSLKLPPGITITKVNGPLTNRKTNNVQSSDYQSVPVNKSGVIVVETEKLMQQTISGSKKSKKKKKKQQQEANADTVQAKPSTSADPALSGMVTLKNPIFHKLQNKLITPNDTISAPLINMNEQATISPGANGMVTIRRSRPIALQNESPLSEFLSPLIHSNNPMAAGMQLNEAKSNLTEERKVIQPPSTRPSSTQAGDGANDFDSQRLSAQNILLGLPGIQITRVNKSTVGESDNCEQQTADVSIIRTGGFNLDKDDWPYESVFTPKDILEDDLDEGERELEAFKRFCQQSVPPKHKEKVAHLNVKDIVLMKKNDVTYS